MRRFRPSTRRSLRTESLAAAEAAWGPHLDDLVACASAARSTDLYLHLPKAGGTAFTATVRRAPGWVRITLFDPSPPQRTPCWCSTGEWGACACWGRDDPAAWARSAVVDGRLHISVGHATFGQLQWLREQLERRGVTRLRTVMTARPVRDRLSSMFRFYFNNVLDPDPDEMMATLSARTRENVLARRVDARHYLRDDGSIDAAAWFRSFAIHTGGVQFFLDDVFGSPRTLRRALANGLVVVPTSAFDRFCGEELGVDPLRWNESRLTRDDPRVVAALAAAVREFEACARRDRAYDAILAEHLGDPAFSA